MGIKIEDLKYMIRFLIILYMIWRKNLLKKYDLKIFSVIDNIHIKDIAKNGRSKINLEKQ